MLTARSVGRRLLKRLSAILWPPRCVLCRRVVAGCEYIICEACAKKLPLAAKDGEECVDARKKQIGFAAAAISPLYYEGAVRDALLRYKFNGLFAYAPVFAGLMAEAVERAVTAGEILPPEVVTFVPISKKRYKTRGYDQAELLARAVAERLGLSLIRTLDKVADTPAQSTLDERARRANVVGAYQAVASASAQIDSKHILLVDDVMTTGATLAEAAKTAAYLLPGSIVCVSAAQTRPKKQKSG